MSDSPSNDKKQLIVQVPNEIIRNKNFDLNSYSFAVYALLKFLHFRNYGKDELQVDHRKLMHKLYISDTRTFKKALNGLHRNGIVLEFTDKLKTKGALNITFNSKDEESKGFTQFNTRIFNFIEDIGVIGFRLLFYYESYIDRVNHIPTRQYCFASLETISKDLKIDKDTIIKYNEVLVKKKLLKIEKHKLQEIGEYNKFDELIFTKYNNHYFVRRENI